MDTLTIVQVDRNSEGVLVTFGDGHTFLFTAAFLLKVRLKEGQVVESPKNLMPNVSDLLKES